MWLGTKDNARKALEVQAEFVAARLEFGPRNLMYTDMLLPDDSAEWVTSQIDEWVCLGGGGQRVAWLCPDDGIVYKVPFWCHGMPQTYCCANRREWSRYREIIGFSAWGLPIRIPKCSLITVDQTHVMAMEHIVGEFTWDLPRQRQREVSELLDISDAHAWNILEQPDGTLVCVDFVD